MGSQGSLYSLVGTRARRGLALLLTALLLSSLIGQSISIVLPARVLAVHDTSRFELDGNVEDPAGGGDDWNTVYTNPAATGAFSTVFITDPINKNGDTYFTGGSTKDISDISSWLWATGSQPQDTQDISHAFAAAYDVEGDLIVYFGLDRYASNGNAGTGFWFLKGPAGTNPDGTFVGTHTDGDVLVQVDYENGGSSPILRVYEWEGNGPAGQLVLKSTGGSCATAPSGDLRCAIANTGNTVPSWPYTPKQGSAGTIPAGGMVEGGINLTDLGLDEGCFASFIATTRSSQEPTSTLSDFAFGSFALCVPPTIETQVRQGDASLGSVGAINLGESVFDRASLTGTKGTVEGTLKFFVCGPNANAVPNCATGGSQVGGTVTLSGGQADSASFTPQTVGYYCFRAEYTPAANSKYLAASHTNSTTECFQVLPANVTITKTAGTSPVSAGSNISFTISWGNSGAGAAFGVVVSDNLPTTAGLDWSISGSTGSGSTCSISGPVGAEVLTCNVGTIPGNTAEHGTVTVTSGTTSASCGTIDNTGSISSTNDGSGSDDASIVVQCPDVKVTKTPDGDDVNAGDGASFSITVENLGPGTATNVSLSDPLPVGQTWALGTVTGDTTGVSCQVTGDPGDQTLSCTDASMASGDAFTVTVTTTVDSSDCGTIDNTATVSAGNEPASATGNNSDDGSIDVLCAQIVIEKTADDGTVNAGDQIGFTITVTNNGLGTAYGVSATDDLPAGFAWSIETPVTGWSLVGSALTFTAASLAPAATSSVHVVATSDAEDCGVVDNTAYVTTTNDGSDSDSASVTIQCPDVTVTKTAVASPVSAGDTIAFDIEVKNLGPGTAYGVTLSDTLPAGIAWTENSADCSISGGVLTCDFGDLAADATASVRVSGETDAADCGTIPNTATVSATNEAEADTGNNSDSDSVVVDCPEISLTKTADAPEVLAGSGIGFVITVSNNGAGNATGVTVTDTLPTNAGLSWSIDEANSDAGWSISGGVLAWGPGTLASGASITVHIVSPTTAATCGDVDNYAAVTTGNDGEDDDDSSITVHCPAISIVKTAGDAADGDELVAKPGDVEFTYVVTNTGTIDLVNIVVVDDNATPDDTSDDVTVDCPATALAPGAQMTCTATLPVGFGVRTNVAEVTGNPDIDTSVEVGDEDDAVVRVPALTIEKSNAGATGGPSPLGEPAAREGDVLTYTLAYDLSDGPVTNGVITDVLPAGLDYVGGSATDNDEFTFVSYDPATRTLRWTAPTVTKDGSVTYQVTATAGASDLTQPLVNVATIVSDETDPDTDQEDVWVEPPPLSETASPRVTLPPTSSLDTGSSQPAPSLLLILALLAGVLLVAVVLTPASGRSRRRNPRDG